MAILAHERLQQRAEIDALRKQLTEVEVARRVAEIRAARLDGELSALKAKTRL